MVPGDLKPGQSVEVRKMTLDDVSAVYSLEEVCFSTPWSAEAFEQEITENSLAHYFVLESEGKIRAYGGYWMIVDEAHITNIAVDPSARRHGFGRILVAQMLDHMSEVGIADVTLEVRESNEAARRLYSGFGFKDAGRRPGYYQSPKEDAVIMWLNMKDN